MNSEVSPFVSVVIPVLKDPSGLIVTLNALEKQTYSKERFEVIVVDNGPSENVREVATKFTFVRYLIEEKRGLHAARNKGIINATGELFAFTDADCIASQDWIEQGVKTFFEIDRCGLVAGRIELTYRDENHLTAAELFEKLTAFDQKKYAEKYHFGATANVFTSKKVIDAVGLLNGELKSGGDVEWGQRVFRAGYQVVYGAKASVKHPARKTIGEILHKTRRVAGGIFIIHQKKSMSFRSFALDLWRDWPSIKDFSEILKDYRVGGFLNHCQVFSILVLLKITRTLEQIRLRYASSATYFER